MSVKVAFIVSHPFQYQFYAPIAQKLRQPVFVLEGRAKTPFKFSDEFVSSLCGSVVRLDTRELIAIDGLVDVIFCMTPVHVLKFFKESKVVALQYSMAKEVYQYGPWRVVADLNLMQGEYSNSKVSGFCSSEIVGNPRYDNFTPEQVGGGGLLYMPTYGELSSLAHFLEALPGFPDDLQIKVKLHHAAEFEDQALIDKLRRDLRVQIIDGYENALSDIALADVVVSDYSGAIFDALYLDRPIALLQPPVKQSVVRTDQDSIEVEEARAIGPVASSGHELCAAVERAVSERDHWAASRRLLREKTISYEGRSADRIVEVLDGLVRGDYEPSTQKRELREAYIRYIEENRKLRRQIQASRRQKQAPKPKKSSGPRILWGLANIIKKSVP